MHEALCILMEDQFLQNSKIQGPHIAKTDPWQPLSDFFQSAVEQNSIFYASRQKPKQYTSPLFKLVQLLRGHPELNAYSSKDALARVNAELKPNWEVLFPHVPVPSLEFLTAWEQVTIPAGVSLWHIVEARVTASPFTLLDNTPCEGYELYLAIAFHLQSLTPRKDILLPVANVSGLLTKMMGKAVSEQSVSYYARLARNDHYLRLTTKAHHPSGKAARYRFDMTRFTSAGVEINPAGTKSAAPDGVFSHGMQGSDGSEGVEGSSGIDGSPGMEQSSSCVLKHAKGDESKAIKTSKGYKTDEDKEENEALHPQSASMVLNLVKPKKAKKKVKRQSVVATWQSVLYSQGGWQEKLPDAEFDMLVNFGRRTDEFGHLILTWTLNNWDTFTNIAVGTEKERPPVPDVSFFCSHEALAFRLWSKQDVGSEESEEAQMLINAAERSIVQFKELMERYASK